MPFPFNNSYGYITRPGRVFLKGRTMKAMIKTIVELLFIALIILLMFITFPLVLLVLLGMWVYSENDSWDWRL